MTEDELIKDIQDELTFSRAMPYTIPAEEIKRIIKNAERYFYDNYRHALDSAYLYIPQEVFQTEWFKKHKTIKLPDCVHFVWQLREPGGANIFGTFDRDFTETKFMGSEIFLTPFMGESLMYRTVMFSFLDLTKGFLIDTLAYTFNKNTNEITVKGRTPNAGAVAEVAKRIERGALFDDEIFQRYVRAKAKIRLGELLTMFDYQLPGNVKINYQNVVTRADKELEEVMTMLKGENTPDWLYMVRF